MTTTLQWHLLPFSSLSHQQLYAIMQLRMAVFVVEQACPYQDLDGKDLAADLLHLFAEDHAEILAYARILPPQLSFTEAAIGRIIIAPAARGTGLGEQLMQRAMAAAYRHWPNQPLRLGAQVYAKGFYQKMGFVADGEIYLEDAIPHIEMVASAEQVAYIAQQQMAKK